jgi:hypothetical protein
MTIAGAIILAVYLLPTLIALRHELSNIQSPWGSPRFAPIYLVNILLGWTIIGWIYPLIWALTDYWDAERRQDHPTAKNVHTGAALAVAAFLIAALGFWAIVTASGK